MLHAINSPIQVTLRNLVNKGGGSLCYELGMNAHISDV